MPPLKEIQLNGDDFPSEIPWELVSSTQVLKAGGPSDVTISMFKYEPEAEEPDLSDDQLIYLKFTVSVASINFSDITSVDIVRNYFDDTIPIHAVLLDLTLRPEPQELGGIKPYFHSAAPLHRRMIETGVIGDDLFEGAVDAQYIGRSGSQIYESTSARVSSTSKSGGIKIPLIGGTSVRTGTTDLSSVRSIDQFVDTTMRDASQERRELISHMTNVENILTLLKAKHLGSPYLRFSLYPRPLRLLSVDPSDPNLWFKQILERRSSGIEGIQEFTTIAVVPRGQEFCVHARLRRISVLDDIPELSREELDPFDFIKFLKLFGYLYQQYPPGTPLEELDIDLTGKLDADFPRPVIEGWGTDFLSIATANVVSPGKELNDVSRGQVNYKSLLEIWRDYLRSEYEMKLERSPLERGTVFAQSVGLSTCLDAGEGEGGRTVISRRSWSTPVTPLPYETRPVGGGVPIRDFDRIAARTQAVTNWNEQEARLTQFLSSRGEFPSEGVFLDNPHIVDLVITRWANLPESSPKNLNLKEAASLFRLSVEHVRALDTAEVSDIRGLARALLAARLLERQSGRFARIVTRSHTKDSPASRQTKDPRPTKYLVSAAIAEDIRRAVGEALQALHRGVEA